MGVARRTPEVALAPPARPSPAGRRAKQSGGRTHVRYGHRVGPSLRALVCPSCAGEARATLPCHERGVLLVGDLSPDFDADEWRVACTRCAHRAGPLSYEAMRAHAPLFFIREAASAALWAFNREHLALVLAVLEGRPVAGHPLERLATYVPGAWKRRRRHHAALARRMLAELG